MPTITVKSLLEAGVHFGHQTSRWNPKMAPYLFGERGGVHVIDLEQTLGYVHDAQKRAEQIAKDGGLIIFVGTKRQAKGIIKEAAERADMPYVIERWLGGTLTNFPTIRERLRLMERLREEKRTGDWDRLPKKEVARKEDALGRLENLLGGLAGLDNPPAALFVSDVARERLAVAEAQKLGLPVIGVIDSNADPEGIDYPIPANDDAVGAIRLIVDAIAEAAGKGREVYRQQSAKEQAAAEAARAQADADAAKAAAKEGDEPAEPSKPKRSESHGTAAP